MGQVHASCSCKQLCPEKQDEMDAQTDVIFGNRECICGNMLACDSDFCRKCGRPCSENGYKRREARVTRRSLREGGKRMSRRECAISAEALLEEAARFEQEEIEETKRLEALNDEVRRLQEGHQHERDSVIENPQDATTLVDGEEKQAPTIDKGSDSGMTDQVVIENVIEDTAKNDEALEKISKKRRNAKTQKQIDETQRKAKAAEDKRRKAEEQKRKAREDAKRIQEAARKKKEASDARHKKRQEEALRRKRELDQKKAAEAAKKAAEDQKKFSKRNRTCKECGNVLLDDSIYCRKCGQKYYEGGDESGSESESSGSWCSDL